MGFVLITGSSKGIGKALANEFASRGYDVILVARTEEKLIKEAERLRQKYQVQVQYLSQDLYEPESAERIFEWCLENNYQINILVNNVGFGLHGYFEKMKKEDLQKIIHLNLSLVVNLVHLFLPSLKKIPGSHILNVSSTAAFQPVPYLAVYSATKAFVNSFTQALREELLETNINVSCLAPGPTDSEFFNESGVDQSLDLSHVKMEPEEVAAKAVDGLFEKKDLIVPGFSNKLGAFISKRISSKPIVKAVGKLLKPKDQ